jgi:hypothetical protein
MEYMPQSTAKKVHIFNYPKASTVGKAKNRVIKESHNFKDSYPAILMMDADDEMTPERPNLIKTAKEEKSPYVVGGWRRFKSDETGEACPMLRKQPDGQIKEIIWKTESNKSSTSAAQNLQFGPWATLFHCDLLPPNGIFFPEDEINNCAFEDLLTWHHLRQFSNLEPTPHKNVHEPVHHYYVHKESVSNAIDQNIVNLKRNTYWALLKLLHEENQDIFDPPPSQKEVNRAMAEYIQEKKASKQMRRSKSNKSLVYPVHPLDELKVFDKRMK